MRSRNFPLALAFSRLEETEETATQAKLAFAIACSFRVVVYRKQTPCD